ncbi:unnamed protein product [Rotaria magnacalcarata]|uniref:Uncharacterized protein n=1 Tax=Rotaria magnacalcarata TaxID=392030 RepID=A0A816ZEA7_9BILA|nr:unnamed protein product [Rotaria magnacalcarata]
MNSGIFLNPMCEEAGTIIAFRWNHLNSNTYRGVPLVVTYLNFVLHEDKHIYSHESRHFGSYAYIGGDVAIERATINKFTAEFIHLASSIHGFVNSLNQEAFNNGQSQLGNVDPHTLSSIFYRYLYIQTYISRGIKSVCTPTNMGDYDLWAWREFPRLLSCFKYLWMNHDQIVGPCNDQCSKCIVVDGHQKCRRRIFSFKDVRIDTDEVKQIVIGCCRTPGSNSRYCDAHINVVCENNMVEEEKVIAPKRALRYDIVQEASNISFCHCTDAIIEENNINYEKNSNIDSNVDRMFTPLDLPASTTDRQNIVRQLKDNFPTY